MSSVRILLADDHAIMRQGMRLLLEAEAGFSVVAEAADGEEALRLAQRVRPDIVVLDISMPRLHGVEAARHLRAALPQTKIVVLTGHDSHRYARVLLRLGVAGYLAKTASAQELVCALRAAHAGRCYVQPAMAALLEEEADDEEEPTPRELEVLEEVAVGLRNVEIAAQLHVTERTVRFHLDNLFRKFRVGSRTELIHAALERSWLMAQPPR